MIGRRIPTVCQCKGVCCIIFFGIGVYHFLAALGYIMSTRRNGQIFQYIFIDVKIKSALTMVVCKRSCVRTAGFYGCNPFAVIVFRNLLNIFGVSLATNTAGVCHNTNRNMRCRSGYLAAIPRVADLVVNRTTISTNIPVIFTVICRMRCISMRRIGISFQKCAIRTFRTVKTVLFTLYSINTAIFPNVGM